MNESSTESEGMEACSWLKATMSDIENVDDFEKLISKEKHPHCGKFADIYRSASREEENSSESEVRVWDFLQGICSLHFKPEDVNEPFGPMVVCADGRRSAAASDFKNRVDVLQALATAATNIVLRARLCDIAWLLDRNNSFFGAEAIKSYVGLIKCIVAGDLRFDSDIDGSFHPYTRDYILRALGLARMLGWSKPEALEAQAQLVTLRERAVAAQVPAPVYWFCELDLRMRISDPLVVAAELEATLENLSDDAGHHIAVSLWRLASRAYQAGKKDSEKQRCQVAAAEVMVAQAEKTSSAMLASHLIANAIAMLHGVASVRQRRLELRHRLVEVQALVGEEMTSFSHEVDLSDLVADTQGELESLNIYDSLFLFADLDASPAPEALKADAIEQIEKYPLSSLFGAAHLDDEGKVLHRTDGAGFGEPGDPAIVQHIAQAERFRREISVSGRIDPARRAIICKHYLSEDIFYEFTCLSPFIPQDLAQTFARGFNRFFQGDFTSAVYILTPLLENSLRYVLKASGHDVTTFDNAGQTQEDRSITSMYDGMRPELDAIFTRAITEDIHRVFLGRPGPAIRHSVAHGLLHDGSPHDADSIYACWLIFRLSIKPLSQHREVLGLS